ncbi:hypothetical protein [Streptomyces sp. NPDC056670]|uniref:hypothetical protein n=1 Tax=Streptomyces sp. NPDC056670 TaxID=3345904 RepID=UPI0036C765C7
MRNWKSVTVTVALGAAVALHAVPAQATVSVPGSNGQGAANAATNGKQVTVGVSKVRYSGDTKRRGAQSTGDLKSVDGNWTPPACWYEPTYSPKEMEAMVKDWRAIKIFGIGDLIGNLYDLKYKSGDPKEGGYKDYNLDKEGKGMFWAAVKNPDREDDPEANLCDKPPFWVDNGQLPKEPMAVSPRVLGEAAAGTVDLTPTEIAMAPSTTSTVNLPTWVWTPSKGFKQKHAYASVAGITATATATPVALHLDPGTSDATLFPASGTCPINADGSIGNEFVAGMAGQTPSCGVTYQRAGTYGLKASVTWKISWTATPGGGDDLPDSIFTTPPQNVTVQEIQSVNR